jgi:hypothetical protein
MLGMHAPYRLNAKIFGAIKSATADEFITTGFFSVVYSKTWLARHPEREERLRSRVI